MSKDIKEAGSAISVFISEDVMAINVQCKSCRKVYALKDTMAGKKARCKQCGGVINIPAIEAKEHEKTIPERKIEPEPKEDKASASGRASAQAAAGDVAGFSASEEPAPEADELPVALQLVQPEPAGLATASFVLGILSITILGILAGIPAIALGFVARGKIKESGGALTGEGKANGGIVLGFISILLTLAIAGVIAFFYATQREVIRDVTEGMPEMDVLSPIDTGRKAASKLALTSIGQVIMIYAMMNDERLPDSLEELVAEGFLDERFLYIPKASGKASEYRYVYLGKGKKITASPATMIIHGVPEAHKGEGCYILTLGSQTEWVTPEELNAERAKEGSGPYEVQKVKEEEGTD